MSTQDQDEARRLLELLIDREGGVSALARKAGMTKGHISGVRHKKPFGPAAQTNLEEALHIRGYFSGRDVLDGDGPVQWLPVKDIEQADKPAPQSAKKIPVAMAVSRDSFVVLMQSDAMMSPSLSERSIPPGVYVIVDPDRPYAPGDDVLVQLKPGTSPCIRRVLRDGEWVYVRAINTDYHELNKIRPDTRVLGRVAGITASY